MRVAIIGGGAAGCFAAANMDIPRGGEVLLFEKTGRLMQKVRVSGGGRCNLTHACYEVPELLRYYPRGTALLKRSLYRFTPRDTEEWFRQRGVMVKTEQDGRVFPVSDDSGSVVDAIYEELLRRKVQLRYNHTIASVTPEAGGFRLGFREGHTYEVDKVLIAAGGYPKGAAYEWIRATGHQVAEPVPSLFTFNISGHPLNRLMGVSAPHVSVKVSGSRFAEEGPVLITHWGLSGPAVLRLSAYAARELAERNYRFEVLVNWTGTLREDDVRETFDAIRRDSGKKVLQTVNPFGLPRRLWEYLLERSGAELRMRIADLSASSRNRLTEALVRDAYTVNGKTTFKEEFVTCGGVKLQEVDPHTLESRIVPGLYFAGEIMDVDGVTGGFNFQHAWSSGMIAAASICRTAE